MRRNDWIEQPLRCSPASQIRASRGERRLVLLGHELAWISAIAAADWLGTSTSEVHTGGPDFHTEILPPKQPAADLSPSPSARRSARSATRSQARAPGQPAPSCPPLRAFAAAIDRTWLLPEPCFPRSSSLYLQLLEAEGGSLLFQSPSPRIQVGAAVPGAEVIGRVSERPAHCRPPGRAACAGKKQTKRVGFVGAPEQAKTEQNRGLGACFAEPWLGWTRRACVPASNPARMDVSALTASMGVEIAVVFVKQTHSRNGISRRAGLRRNPLSVLPAPRAQTAPKSFRLSLLQRAVYGDFARSNSPMAVLLLVCFAARRTRQRLYERTQTQPG